MSGSVGRVGSSWGGGVEDVSLRLAEGLSCGIRREKGTCSLVVGVGRGLELDLEEKELL